MSGSSLDGLDLALCLLEDTNGPLQWTIQSACTIPYSDKWKTKLFHAPSLNGFELMKLDAEFGSWLGQEIMTWMKNEKLNADLIASHGHTIFHEPKLGFTTQIGSGAHIALQSGVDTITTFRAADVAAGGQGAPFAPAVDRKLFPGYQGYLNLGGIANIHLLTKDNQWKAWDIGPCNQALNHLASKLGKAYDHDGQMAEQGKVHADIVSTLVNMFPFSDGIPRGLSNAEVRLSWLSFLDESKESVEDLLASVMEAISLMIAQHLHPLISDNATILVTGGGAHNKKLVDKIKSKCQPYGIQFEIPSSDVIDFKECVLMAYLGYLTMNEKPYEVNSVTGAAMDTIGGAFFKGSK